MSTLMLPYDVRMPLHDACYNLDFDKVKYLVENKIVPIDKVDCFGQTTLTDSDNRQTKGFLCKLFKHG